MITRYDHTEEDVMEARPDGEWIRFSDHEAEIESLKDLILVLRGFRQIARDRVKISGDGQTESRYVRLCWRCRAPEPCGCGAERI